MGTVSYQLQLHCCTFANMLKTFAKEIAKQTLFQHDDQFIPIATGFGNPEKVAEIQEKISSHQNVAVSLDTIVERIEEKYRTAGIVAMGFEVLSNLINVTQEKPNEIARAITRRAVAILQSNPTASLLSAWSDETIQLLEVSKAEAFEKGKAVLVDGIIDKDKSSRFNNIIPIIFIISMSKSDI